MAKYFLNNEEYTLDEITSAAAKSGLDIDSYIEEYNIEVREEEEEMPEEKVPSNLEGTIFNQPEQETNFETQLENTPEGFNLEGNISPGYLLDQDEVKAKKFQNSKEYQEAIKVDKAASDKELTEQLIRKFEIAEADKSIGGYNVSTTYTPTEEDIKEDLTEEEFILYKNWKKTGNLFTSEVDENNVVTPEYQTFSNFSQEKITKQKKLQTRKLVDDLPGNIRKKVLENQRKNKVFSDIEYEREVFQYQTNLEDLGQTYNNIQNSKNQGIEPTAEDINAYNTKLNEVKKQSSNLVDLAAERKDADLMIDAFKRNYGTGYKLAGTFAELGSSFLLGTSELVDMLAKDADYDSDLTKHLIEVDKSIKEYNEEYLPTAIGIDDVYDPDTFLMWAADATVKFTPYALALATPYAMPFYITTGATSKVADYKREEIEAEKRIEQAHESLENLPKTAENAEQRQKILDFIEQQNTMVNVNRGTKLLSSAIYGAAEGIDAITDKFLLGGGSIKKVFKALEDVPDVDKLFSKALKKSIYSIPSGAGIEVAQENTTGVIQNLVDIANGKDISIFENAKETTAQAIMFGSGFRLVNTASVAKGAILNEIATVKEKNIVNKSLEKINILKQAYSKVDKTRKGQREYAKKLEKDIADLETEIVKVIDSSILSLMDLPFEDQKEVFELARKARKVRNSYKADMLDTERTDEEKDIIAEKRAKEYEEIQNRKRALINSKKQIKSDKISDPDTDANDRFNRFDEQGLRNISAYKLEKIRIGIDNEKRKLYKKEYEVDSGLEGRELAAFIDDESKKTYTLLSGQEINKEEARLILAQMNDITKDKNGNIVSFSAAMHSPDNESITYFVDRIALDKNAADKPLHEYTHAMLAKMGISKEEFKKIFNSLDKEIDNNPNLSSKDKLVLKNIKKIYKDYSEADKGNELLVAIGELIRKDVLNERKNADLFQVLGFRLKNIVNRIAGKDVADGVNLNTIDGAKHFLTNFQKGIRFNSQQNITIRAAQEDKEANNLASRSNLQDLLSAEENKAAFIAKTLQDSKGEFPDSMLDSKFGQELAPILENLAKKRFDPIPEDATRIVDENRSNARKQWKEELLNELIADVSNNYKPGEQNLDKYVTIRAFQRSNRTAKKLGIESIVEKGGGGIATDITEAFNVASEQVDTASESIADLLNLSKEFKTKVLDLEEKAILKAEKALVGKDFTDVKKLKERNKAFAEIFVDRLFKDIATELGKNTKTSDAFSQYLDKNFEPLLNTALTYIDFQMGSGISSNWSLDNPPSKEEFIDYYEGKDIAPDKPASVKSDRKKSLINAISRGISNESRVKLAKTEIGEKFKSAAGIGLASRSPVSEELFLYNGKNFIKQLEKELGLESGTVKLQNFQTFEEFKEHIELQKKYIWSRVPKEFIQFSLSATSNMYANQNFRQVNEKARNKNKLKEYVLKEIADFKNWGPAMLDQNGEVITKFKNQPYKNSIQSLGNNITKGYEEGTHNKEAEQRLREFNSRNNRIGRQMFNRFNEAVIDDPNAAVAIAQFFQLATNNAEHPIRYLAEVVGFSLNPKGATSKTGTFKLLEYEHAMQQVHVGRTLILSMLSSDRNFHIDLEAVLNNFKLIALDQADNLKLKNAGYMHDMPVDWEVFSSSWLERYFNDMVAMHGGIDPNGIIHITGKTFAEVYNVNTNGFNPPNVGLASRSIYNELQAIDELESNFKITPESKARREELLQELKDQKLQPIYDELQAIDELESNFTITPDSKKRREELQNILKNNFNKPDIGLASRVNLSLEFNKILEDQSGVKAEAIYSEDRARKLAGKAGKFQFFIPYSAEDFIGLTYPTLAKGKKGERAQQWYKDNIIQPYARGYRDYEADKTNTLNKWEALKKQIKNTPSNLKKDAVRGFSNEEAIRVYLWNKQDVAPETLAKKDISALTKYVEGNKQLLDFAQQIQSLLGVDGYPNPTSDWLSGTLTTDLVGHVNTVSRAKHLKEWSDNVDIVYSKDNLNKLRALYGDKYVEALVNSINRMKSGRNRISGNRLESAWLNYIGSGAVGTIMFFNSRSALLQTISSLNYVNFTFNNPLAVAKAFANQPQFWKDFSFLFNSDYMQSRRKGLKTDIDADEIANAAAMSKNKVRAALSYILKKGYLPTQYADNFAIAFGGASFYRNRINSYIKQGLSEKEAQEKAFLEFQETSEEAQQSARPDKISMQQASSLGRLILAFANTPMQYARIIKKSSLDLVNGRGDWKTNLGKIIWYSAMQNLIFTSLQQALFAMAFDDDDDTSEKDKEKYIRTLNGMADTILRGTGVGGAVISVIKNGILKYIEEQNSKRPDYTKVGLEAINLSPPISSRIKKMINIGRVFTYKQTRKEMRELGYDIDNPYYQVAGQALSATFNLPADRLVQKMRNIKDALDDQNETWQRIALALGWPDWQLGMVDTKPSKTKGKKGFKFKPFKPKPFKKLKKGVAGVAHKDGTIEIAPDLSPKERKLTIIHEQQHQIDMKSGKLNYDKNFVYYNGNKYARKSGKIMYNGKAYKEGDPDLPWEKRAYKAEKTRKFLYA